jgi:phage tail-like protein
MLPTPALLLDGRTSQGAATMARKDPLRNFRFRVEIDGIAVAGFSEVVIGPTTTEPIDYREGTDPPHVRKLPGLTKFANITLKRGLTDSLDLYHWYKQVIAGQTSRRQVAIVIADETGADHARFVVSEAWPAKYEPSELNAAGNEVIIETLELVNEGIERVQ